jgi:tetrahydromethanopterin S-methyltransferase subunit C
VPVGVEDVAAVVSVEVELVLGAVVVELGVVVVELGVVVVELTGVDVAGAGPLGVAPPVIP